MCDYQEFSIILDLLGEDSALCQILAAMATCHQITMDAGRPEIISTQLGKQHDEIRHYLHELGIIDSLDGFDTIFVCDMI